MSLIGREDRDAATEPLLTNQPSSNLIVDFYSQKNTFLPSGSHGDSTVALQPTRTIYSPQHPSQDLIEMLNRNQELNHVRLDRKHRKSWRDNHWHTNSMGTPKQDLHKDKREPVPSAAKDFVPNFTQTKEIASHTAEAINTEVQTRDTVIDLGMRQMVHEDSTSQGVKISEHFNNEAIYTQDKTPDKTLLKDRERTTSSELTLTVENLLS